MSLEFMINMLSWVSFITGGFFLFVGSLGMVRLEEFWARLHAASVIDSAGAGLILFGMMLQAGWSLLAIKIFIIVIFLFLTGPTASHAVANAAFVSGSRPPDMLEDVTNTDSPTAKPPAKKRSKKPKKA